MAKYIFLYYNGGDPSQTSKEEMEGIMADWGKWYEEMGSSIVDGGAPFGPNGQAVSRDSADPVGEWPASGYTIIEADSMEAAVEKAKGHPMHKHTDGEAVIRVYEAMPM